MKHKPILIAAKHALPLLAAFALLLAACAPYVPPAATQPPATEAATEAPTAGKPSVSAGDQAIVDGTVTIDSATMTGGRGWVTIHAEADGAPGPVIGQTAIPEGTSTNVVVNIDAAQATSKLFAMLHVDAGVVGAYEFPGPDAPLKDGDAIVMAPFNVQSASSGSSAVTIQGFAFGPNALEVKVGTTITWTNNDGAPHTVTADDGSFDSGRLNPGGTFSFTFAQAGTFAYHCNIHPSMVGTITVVP